MAANINRVLLAGNLGKDPEVRFLANEQVVANFSLAINRRWKGSDGEMKEETTWVDCSAFGKVAENVGKYLVKGSSCFVEGRLKLETWEDKNDGKKRSRMKVVAEAVQFLSYKDRGEGKPVDGEDVPSGPATPAAAKPLDDEPPF